MRTITFTLLFLTHTTLIFAQKFTRSELPVYLDTPWEITYGKDSFLWVTESKGRVSRVNPSNGSKTVVYTAPDYFNGSSSERSEYCFQPRIGSGTLGLALHPDFPDTSYIYFVHSYNMGSPTGPKTRFKIVRLRWDTGNNKVVEANDIVTDLPTGYDHLGGRLLALKQAGRYFLYISIGDNGVSEQNNPDCYLDQATNPNNYTQNPDFKNGKIHRFYIDGTIPFDNPIPENSFFTRGHRNPQGLIHNPNNDMIYAIEHGDRSDDEINILYKGMNYGWKNARGYHYDNNFEGESNFVSSYTPHPLISNDSLVSAFYSWCSGTPSTDPNNSNWCTVAPSDGIYYESLAIPEWTNSLLVVTLKNGTNTDQQVYQFKLNPDGKSLVPSTTEEPNPKTFFSEDQSKNGRLRDIAISPDGKKIFLINNGGASNDKITVYTYQDSAINTKSKTAEKKPETSLYPNPVKDLLTLKSEKNIEKLEIANIYGSTVMILNKESREINVSQLIPGIYILKIITVSNEEQSLIFLKE